MTLTRLSEMKSPPPDGLPPLYKSSPSRARVRNHTLSLSSLSQLSLLSSLSQSLSLISFSQLLSLLFVKGSPRCRRTWLHLLNWAIQGRSAWGIWAEVGIESMITASDPEIYNKIYVSHNGDMLNYFDRVWKERKPWKVWDMAISLSAVWHLNILMNDHHHHWIFQWKICSIINKLTSLDISIDQQLCDILLSDLSTIIGNACQWLTHSLTH